MVAEFPLYTFNSEAKIKKINFNSYIFPKKILTEAGSESTENTPLFSNP